MANKTTRIYVRDNQGRFATTGTVSPREVAGAVFLGVTMLAFFVAVFLGGMPAN